MSKHKKILIFTGGLLLSFFLFFLSMPGSWEMLMVKPRFDRLIYKTNHHELLVACRQLMNKGFEGQYVCKWPDKNPEVENFPEIILQLKPTYVWIHDEGYVDIELFGGMSHYGVIAYTADFNEPYERFNYGNKKLIDGLWFQSDFIDLSNVNLGKKK
jgi:hypothetical protein